MATDLEWRDFLSMGLSVHRYGGRLCCSVTIKRDTEPSASTYRFEGSATSIESLDEALSLIDGAVLAWLIGLKHEPVSPGGADELA